jgi:hypothetical protein
MFSNTGVLTSALLLSCLLSVADDARLSTTETLDFPAGGTLCVQNSTGDLLIEGWDQTGVEITTTMSAKKKRDRDRVQISTKRDGAELVVTTTFPHHRALPYVTPLSTVTNFDLEYHIKVPRSVKLIVKHDDGEVHIDDVTGNIQVKARQGLIALRLAGETPPAIDAKSDFGSVNSDFAGNQTRHPWWPFAPQFVGSASSAPQQVHLKIGCGDIVILKAHKPAL